MLPTLHQNAYQKLLTLLRGLREQLDSPNSRVTVIQEKFQQIQQVFQEEVMLLESDELEGTFASHFQSMQTEMHRALRLLGTDILFLRSSKQAATSEQRLAAIRDRVDNSIGFCQAILTFESE
ncbi:MAG: heterocyst frequency control protein PatD [Hydrococcus sp. C42_A2020_068]|uniref:heterocyst frequency control protein PatD n=1 Tax=Pleurocapsa sp. PCC 7327 TaxID=118163 RepID=UPI00029F8176|nr:heterocyst frequency control protein PatD [Pleurocapsa sp. PCC 7327]AFY76574.1 hypothetical protein Ple7327_1171 [Pleurocapsa sp. PCC 7327]MBF2022563.1 heterocyst frequency control protein PatD [Hydrococcus sp. C42_A2020_068]